MKPDSALGASVDTSARQGLLGVVGGPAHDPRVDVVPLAASAWMTDLVAPPQRKELLLAISHLCRDGAVDAHGAESQPSQNSVDGHDVGHWTRLGLIQLLRPALARLSPPRRRAPVVQQVFVQFVNGLHKVR